MLNKLFNSKNKYYLELDEVKDSKPVQAVVQTANKVAEVVKEKTADVVETKPVQEAIKTTNEVTNTAQAKLQSATDTKAKPKQQNNKVAAKSQEQTATKAAPAPKNSGASSYDPPFWVAAMYKNNSSGSSNNGKGGETFATDNLMPTVTQYRRRPGPSLNKFKNMARQSRTPRI
ncbi:MAG: hypothetical protein ACRC06_15875 [Waterburya sp.]